MSVDPSVNGRTPQSPDVPGDDVLFRGQGVTRTFGRGKHLVEAVKDVNFSLSRGQITTVVGESGSGKSTLARMVLRLLSVTEGTLEFNGKDVTSITITKAGTLADAGYWRDVQAVFQDPFSSFNQFFTVRRLLSRSFRLIGSNEAGRTRMEEALNHVGLHGADVLDRYPHQLSGGQRQRVMIARALMMRPKLLVADEATSMLDASLRVNILNVLTDLRDELGMTILFITHDIGQACYVADQVLVMENGLMVEQGTADQVIFDPQHEYTRRLLSDVPRLSESL